MGHSEIIAHLFFYASNSGNWWIRIISLFWARFIWKIEETRIQLSNYPSIKSYSPLAPRPKYLNSRQTDNKTRWFRFVFIISELDNPLMKRNIDLFMEEIRVRLGKTIAYPMWQENAGRAVFSLFMRCNTSNASCKWAIRAIVALANNSTPINY